MTPSSSTPEDTTVPEASADVAEMPSKMDLTTDAEQTDTEHTDTEQPSKFGKISWDICNRLRCSSCGNAASAPVQQCRSGHVLCGQCSNRLVTCPTKNCEVSVKFLKDLSTNAALATICHAAGVLLPCRKCHARVRHADLARHEKYCVLIRNGFMSPSLLKEEEEQDSDPDTIARAAIREELNCSLCNHAAPAPILQCRNGHVACYHCLGRLRQFDSGEDSIICPLCKVKSDGTVVRNLHLEGMATFCQITVPCRWCDVQVNHADLKDHLDACEHQPVKCIHCNNTKGVALHNWDAMWDHYKEEHLQTFPPMPLDEMIVSAEKIESLKNTSLGLGFLTWNHCLDPATGKAVGLFPGLLYHRPMDVFYFSVRRMGPLNDDLYRMRVQGGGLVVEAVMPATSYRVGYLDNATLATAAKMIRGAPCLALSRPTVERMLELSANEQDDGSICFSIAQVKNHEKM